jgi:hypothetical protein
MELEPNRKLFLEHLSFIRQATLVVSSSLWPLDVPYYHISYPLNPKPPSSFHLFIYLGKKKHYPPHPSPSTVKKKKQKNQGAPFPPLHNEYNINHALPGIVKSNLSKLQAIKK